MSVPPALLAALSDRFEWIELLGEGASGWVSLVEERALGRRVALKLGKQRGDAVQLGRFEREARIAAGIRHPNAVAVHSTGVVEGHPYLVLDYVEGARTLNDAAHEASLEERLGYLLDVTRAMAHAHELSVVHRDLKPDNVLVDPTGAARVTDFGCATMRGVDRLTKSGAAVGTPVYMPPEQFGERELVGPHSDVWSLGVMLYEVACGRLPFAGESIAQLAGQIMGGVSRCDLLPGVPKGVRAVILRCLRLEPGARYPDAGALLAALDEVLAASGARREGPPLRGLVALLVALVLLASGLAVWALGMDAPSAKTSTSEEASSQVDDRQPSERARWEQAQGETTAAGFLSAGEAWLEAFPDSPLGADVEVALFERRLQEPRWVFENEGSRVPQVATTRDLLLFLFESPDGVALHSGPWSGESRVVHGVRGGPPWGLKAGAAGHGFWLLGEQPSVGRSVTYFAELSEVGEDLELSVMNLASTLSGYAVSSDGRSCAVLYPERWVRYEVQANGEVLSNAMGIAPPGTDGKHLAFDASGEQLIFVGRPAAAVTGTLSALRLATAEISAKKGFPYSVRALLTLSGGETLVSNNNGQLLLYDAEFNHVGAFVDKSVPSAGFIRERATVGALDSLACGLSGLVYAVAMDESSDCKLQVWRLDDRELLRNQRIGWTLGLCLSPNGRYLACVGRERVEIWDRWVPDEWEPTR